MAKFMRIVVRRSGQIIDVPIDEGNTFVNCVMQMRLTGFALDGRINAYVPLDSIELAMQIDTDAGTTGMTKQ